jgi:hypothetical protein
MLPYYIRPVHILNYFIYSCLDAASVNYCHIFISFYCRLCAEYEKMYEFARREPANVADAVQLLLQITAAQEKDLPLLSTRVDYVETLLEYLTKYGHFSNELTCKSIAIDVQSTI